jgi:hypothetical protein
MKKKLTWSAGVLVLATCGAMAAMESVDALPLFATGLVGLGLLARRKA